MLIGTTFVLLFVVASLVAVLAQRLRIPYTVALVLAGLALGAAGAFAPPRLTRELLFAVFLPGLIFEAALHLPLAEFRRNRRTIGLLAIPGVLLGAALIAVLLAPSARALGIAPALDWPSAFAFAALVSATDPIAVVALVRQLGAPPRLSLLMDGESLANDGTAVVLFTLVLAVIGGAGLSIPAAAVEFVVVVGLGALVGLAFGAGMTVVLRQLDDPMVEITLTTIAAYGSFLLAERVHASGIIATMTTGMVIGSSATRRGMSASSRLAVNTFWEYVAFALNSVIFLLIGFTVRLDALIDAWPAILLAWVVVTAARALLVGAVSAATARSAERLPRGWATALTWGGLRGALAMVLALSLPTSLASRDLLVTMTFGVVVLTILVQGLTMAPLLRRLGVVQRGGSRDAYEAAKGELGIARAALEELDAMRLAGRVHPAVAARLHAEYEQRVGDAETRLNALPLDQASLASEELQRARRHLLVVERERADDAYRSGALGVESYDRLLADIDARWAAAESDTGLEPPSATPEPAAQQSEPER